MANRLDRRGNDVRHNSHASGSFLRAGKLPVLTREEEAALMRRVRQAPPGDPSTHELVLANLAFIMKVAAEYRNMGLPFEDLVGEGSLGVIEAASHFDPSRGTRFLTYAVWWIRKGMLRALARQASLVQVPAYQIKKLRSVASVHRRLSKELGREADRDEISREMRMAPSTIDAILRVRAPELSLDEPRSEDGDLPLADRLADDRSADPEHALLQHEDAELLQWALGTLTDQERRVIMGRFGFEGGREATLRELGARMHLSRERIRQLEVQATERLRRAIAGQHRWRSGVPHPWRPRAAQARRAPAHPVPGPP